MGGDKDKANITVKHFNGKAFNVQISLDQTGEDLRK
jgi:hypothetical protein